LRWSDPYLRETPDALREIDVPDPRAANITTVVWATGYRYDFGWIDCPVFDERGASVQQAQRMARAEAGVASLSSDPPAAGSGEHREVQP